MPEQLMSLLLFLAGAATTLGVEWLRTRHDARTVAARESAARDARRREYQIDTLGELQPGIITATKVTRDLVWELRDRLEPPGDLAGNVKSDRDLWGEWERSVDEINRLRSRIDSAPLREVGDDYADALVSVLDINAMEKADKVLAHLNTASDELLRRSGERIRELLASEPSIDG